MFWDEAFKSDILAMYIICASQTVSKDHDFLIKCLDDGSSYTHSLIYYVYCKSFLKSSSHLIFYEDVSAKASSNVWIKDSQGSQIFDFYYI